MASRAQQVDDTKGSDMNYDIESNNKTYLFRSSKFLSSSIISFIKGTVM